MCSETTQLSSPKHHFAVALFSELLDDQLPELARKTSLQLKQMICV